MKIIVDMMGGDNAPLAVLEGTAQAVKEYGVQVIGVGSEELVRKTAAEHNIPLDGIELVNCTETIEMCDEPARAIRSKKDSSIVVGLNLLKEGKGDAFVSAGSTGALHVGASLIVRTLKGVKRPALATMVPAKNKAYLLLDCGANVECRPEMLAAFAVMGSCYVNKVEGRTAPTVALANNGAEESKGTPMLREAHQLLKATPGIRFVGNIEPRDVPNGDVDVVVCDGFTGNVILKLTEAWPRCCWGCSRRCSWQTSAAKSPTCCSRAAWEASSTRWTARSTAAHPSWAQSSRSSRLTAPPRPRASRTPSVRLKFAWRTICAAPCRLRWTN